MADQRISVHDRVRTIDYLEWLAFQLNAAASWTGDAGCETEADLIEQAAKSILASCWLLSRPVRAALPPERWQPADGYPPR